MIVARTRPDSATGRAARRLLAALIAFAGVVSCSLGTEPQVLLEPEVWRSYQATRLNTEAVPVLWGVTGADTNRLVSYRIELRVDGTTAWRSAFKVSTNPDTFRVVSLGTHALVGDSIRIGDMRFAITDTMIAVPERLWGGQYWYFRLLPSSRAAP